MVTDSVMTRIILMNLERCFRGNLEDFEAAVLKTHENNKTHREAYLKEIEKVKFLIS